MDCWSQEKVLVLWITLSRVLVLKKSPHSALNDFTIVVLTSHIMKVQGRLLLAHFRPTAVCPGPLDWRSPICFNELFLTKQAALWGSCSVVCCVPWTQCISVLPRDYMLVIQGKLQVDAQYKAESCQSRHFQVTLWGSLMDWFVDRFVAWCGNIRLLLNDRENDKLLHIIEDISYPLNHHCQLP